MRFHRYLAALAIGAVFFIGAVAWSQVPTPGSGSCYGNDIPPGANVNVDQAAASCFLQRGNYDTGAIITLSTTPANSADQINWNGRGLICFVNIVSITGTTPTLTVTIQGKDTAGGVYAPLLTSAALAAAGVTTLTVYPGAATTANVSAPSPLTRTWRISPATGGTVTALTGDISCSVID